MPPLFNPAVSGSIAHASSTHITDYLHVILEMHGEKTTAVETSTVMLYVLQNKTKRWIGKVNSSTQVGCAASQADQIDRSRACRAYAEGVTISLLSRGFNDRRENREMKKEKWTLRDRNKGVKGLHLVTFIEKSPREGKRGTTEMSLNYMKTRRFEPGPTWLWFRETTYCDKALFGMHRDRRPECL